MSICYSVRVYNQLIDGVSIHTHKYTYFQIYLYMGVGEGGFYLPIIVLNARRYRE